MWRLVLVAAACGEPYVGDTLPVPAAHLGCVDVALQRGERAEARGPVVVYELGNRCEHSVRVDLGAVRVYGVDDVERHIDLVAFDPDHEIGPRDMDARAHGEEWIEYHPIVPADIRTVEVDLGALVAGETPLGHWQRLRLR